jgi:hypothetical protein
MDSVTKALADFRPHGWTTLLTWASSAAMCGGDKTAVRIRLIG